MNFSYLYLNIIKNKKKNNIIIYNKKYKIFFIFYFKFAINKLNICIKLLKIFLYQNGIKNIYIYPQNWLTNIKHNFISKLLDTKW